MIKKLNNFRSIFVQELCLLDYFNILAEKLIRNGSSLRSSLHGVLIFNKGSPDGSNQSFNEIKNTMLS